MSQIVGVSGTWPAGNLIGTLPSWGYFTQKETDFQADENELLDESNEVIALLKSKERHVISFEASIKAAAAPGDTDNAGINPTNGDLSFAHPFLGAVQVVMSSLSVVEAAGDFVKIRGSATYYPSMTGLTTTTTT